MSLENNPNQLRFGISALDLSHRNISEPDELMVRSVDGKIFYKRLDGQIVSDDNKDFDKLTLENIIYKSGAIANTLNSHFMIYNIINIANRSTMNHAELKSLGIEPMFITCNPETGFWIRIRGSEETNAAVTAALTSYNKLYPDNDLNEVSLKIQVSTPNSIQELVYTIKYNELVFIPIPDTFKTAKNPLLVTILGIGYPKISQAFKSINPALMNKLMKMNYDNTFFEPDRLDIVSYTEDITSDIIYNESEYNHLKMIIPVTQLIYDVQSSLSGGSGIVIQEEQPEYECIWGQPIHNAETE